MPLLHKLPEVSRCCGCITDLKTAVAIIAVMGIVTSPALSWAVVRHAYVIRVSCFVTTSATRPDVVDVNLNNILSFGFGANAGLGPSCLSKNSTKLDLRESEEETDDSALVIIVKYFGWFVLLVDLIFLFTSINFLVKMFKGADQSASKIFMITALVSVILSFIYGMLFVGACIYIGGSFPIFEFFFSIFDLVIWVSWLHFLCVLWSYYYGHLQSRSNSFFWTIYHYIADLTSKIFGISSIHRVSIISTPQCKSLYKYNSPMLLLLDILLYLFYLFEIVLLSSGVVMLLSIFIKPNIYAADFYICCALITAIVSVVFAIVQIVQGFFVKCGFQYQALTMFFYFIMWIYFVFVINTYRDEIDVD